MSKLTQMEQLYLDMIARDGAPTEENVEQAEYLRSIAEEPNE